LTITTSDHGGDCGDAAPSHVLCQCAGRAMRARCSITAARKICEERTLPTAGQNSAGQLMRGLNGAGQERRRVCRCARVGSGAASHCAPQAIQQHAFVRNCEKKGLRPGIAAGAVVPGAGGASLGPRGAQTPARCRSQGVFGPGRRPDPVGNSPHASFRRAAIPFSSQILAPALPGVKHKQTSLFPLQCAVPGRSEWRSRTGAEARLGEPSQNKACGALHHIPICAVLTGRKRHSYMLSENRSARPSG